MHQLKARLEGSVLIVEGHLEETSSLELLLSLMAQAKQVHLQGLFSVSWLGLERLLLTLAPLEKPLEMIAVTAPVYKLLQMLPQSKSTLIPLAPSILIRDSGDLKEHQISRSELTRLMKEEILGRRTLFSPLSSQVFLLGSLSQLTRWPGDSVEVELTKVPDIPIQWHDYLMFTHTCLVSCAIALQASLCLSEEMLHSLVGSVREANQLYRTISNPDPRYDFKNIQEALAQTQELSDSSQQEIHESIVPLCHEIFDFQSNYFDFLGGQRMHENKVAPWSETFRSYGSKLTGLEKVCPFLDKIGVKFGETIMSFSYVTQWYQELQNACGTSSEPQSLASLSKKLKVPLDIPDFFIKISDLIHSLSEKFEEETSRSMIALQQFDIIRQVVEHRLNESNFLQESSHPNDPSDDTLGRLMAELRAKAADRAVTNIEKYAYDFFFPYAPRMEETSMPGDGETFFF